MNQTLPTSDTLLWEALPDLTLNIAQTAALCGISVRQLGYWTRQGYVAAQGRGARRTYGLDAVRRLLAIRKAMIGGASLRQALRQVGAVAPSPVSSPPPDPPSLSPVPFQDAPAPAPSSFLPSLSAREAEALARSLCALFETNRQTRDDAAGLSVKLGRAENDVRAAAEDLCAAGVLLRSICQDTIIFQYGDQEAAHA